MELKNNIVSFNKLHKISLETLSSKGVNSKNNLMLLLIGEWYYKFLNSAEKHVSLNVPFFDSEMKDTTLEYLFVLDLLYKLINLERTENFEDTAIFDIYSYNSSNQYGRNEKPFYLEFKKVINNAVFFGDETVLSINRFFPVFQAEQLATSSGETREAIFDAFYIFKQIANENIIDYPILIDLEKDLSLFVTKSISFNQLKLNSQCIVAGEVNNDDELDQIILSCDDKDFKNNIYFKYPYQTNIDSRIESFVKKTKQFDLNLKHRLSYNEIKESDLILLPEELKENKSFKTFDFLNAYEIINTNHNENIYNKLRTLKINWQSASFNIYKTPFPAKWFMCIHRGEDLNFWKERYKKDFPLVNGILLEDTLQLIELIYELDWIGIYLQENKKATAFIPKSNIFPEVLHSFKKHIDFKFLNTSYFDIPLVVDELLPKEIMILDPFNTIVLSNTSVFYGDTNIKIIVPDFLYFNYQPYIKYHIAKYHISPLLEGIRQHLDKNHKENLIFWNENKTKLLQEISLNLKEYNKKYTKIEILIEEELETPDSATLSFTEEEIIDFNAQKEIKIKDLKTNTLIDIETTTGDTLTFTQYERILIKENEFIINGKAIVLQKGSCFVPVSEITLFINRDLLSEKLTQIPSIARRWQIELKNKEQEGIEIYNVLTNLGLEISSNHFENNYLIEENEILAENLPSNLPRKNSNWEVICDYLGISEIDKNQARISYFGRKDLNKLKSLYKEIISILVKENRLGEAGNPELISRVANLIMSRDILEKEQEIDYHDTAKSIIMSIVNEIKFYTVKTINTKTI